MISAQQQTFMVIICKDQYHSQKWLVTLSSQHGSLHCWQNLQLCSDRRDPLTNLQQILPTIKSQQIKLTPANRVTHWPSPDSLKFRDISQMVSVTSDSVQRYSHQACTNVFVSSSSTKLFY